MIRSSLSASALGAWLDLASGHREAPRSLQGLSSSSEGAWMVKRGVYGGQRWLKMYRREGLLQK